MKTLMIGLLVSTVSFAGGFECEHQKIFLTPNGNALHFKVGDEVIDRIPLPAGNDVSTYQDRWSTFNELIIEAQLRFPYMPETILVMHIARSKKLYLQGFRAADDLTSNQWVKLPRMYCSALVQALHEI